MKRIYHHYLQWEEFHAGMWRKESKQLEEILFNRAVEFTGDAKLYGSFMLKVLDAWPISCEHNLTDTGMNRKAWIGHAACCLAIKCPEHVTRRAWGYLSQEQQDDANEMARLAIKEWEKRHAAKNPKIHRSMGEARLRGRDTGFSRREVGELVQGSLIPHDLPCNSSQ
jgi:hypothetical protein